MDFVIAFDGLAASGKGTLATALATDYALPYLDTGLLYRGVAYAVLSTGDDPGDAAAAEAAAYALDISELSNSALRTGLVGEAASQVAAHPAVRSALYDLQRSFALQPGGAVLDGRDIGTVIAPEAPAKFWVEAALETRARRRWVQTNARGDPRSVEATIEALATRDALDASRATAPMVRAPDAVLLDTTRMSISEAVDAARRIVEAARARWLEASSTR